MEQGAAAAAVPQPRQRLLRSSSAAEMRRLLATTVWPDSSNRCEIQVLLKLMKEIENIFTVVLNLTPPRSCALCSAGFLAGQDIEKSGSQYTVATTTFANSKAGS